MKKNKVKVLHLELSGTIGGIESFLLNVYSCIDREQIQFDFVTTSEIPALGEELELLGAHIWHVPSYKSFFSYCREIKKIISANEFEILHIHKNSATNIIPFIIAKICGVKTIIAHSHNTAPTAGRFSKIIHYINRPILNRLYTTSFACSEIASDWLFGKSYGKDGQVQLIRNGVDTKKFTFDGTLRKQKREELNVTEQIVLCHVGRFTEQKNHKFLIEVFNQFQKDKDCVLLLIGEGPLEEQVRQQVKGLGLEEKVIFCGTRRDIHEIFQAADLLIFPSLYEGLPVVGIEAQATGLPIIASEDVSKQLQITDLVQFLSLKDSAEIWAKEIEKRYSETKNKRRSYQVELMNQGYDIRYTCEYLKEYYSQCVED